MAWEDAAGLPRFSVALHGAAGLLGAMLARGVPRVDLARTLSALLDDIERQSLKTRPWEALRKERLEPSPTLPNIWGINFRLARGAGAFRLHRNAVENLPLDAAPQASCLHGFIGFRRSVVERPEPLIERHHAVGVVHLEIFVMQVVSK